MHVPALLSRSRGSLSSVLGMVLRATGARTPLPLACVALAVVLLYPDGTIERMGPVPVQPPAPVLLLVPLLLATACSLAHIPWPSAVIVVSPRVLAARFGCYVVWLGAALLVAALGGALADVELTSGAIRNVLWLSGVAMATGALVGLAYGWIPVVVLGCGGLLSTPSEWPWSWHGMLFHHVATSGQMTAAASLCVLGLGLAVADPVGRGYLRREHRGVPQED